MRQLHYLATPYSLFDKGPEAAFVEAAKAAAVLLKRGMAIFSPIANSHPVAVHGEMDALAHDVWMPLDLEVLDRCDALIVVMMPGWKDSRGIAMEIARARETGKPISYLTWPMLQEREQENEGR